MMINIFHKSTVLFIVIDEYLLNIKEQFRYFYFFEYIPQYEYIPQHLHINKYNTKKKLLKYLFKFKYIN